MFKQIIVDSMYGMVFFLIYKIQNLKCTNWHKKLKFLMLRLTVF